MDRRQQKTRAAIFDAFAALLAKKSYHRITVGEIIADANVGRTTFYAHFPTKDDLLKEVCVDLFDHVFTAAPINEGGHDFRAAGDDFAAVSHLLCHLQENDRNILGILRRGDNPLFAEVFREYCHRYVATDLLPRVAAVYPAVPPEFLRRYLTATFIELVQWWIDGDLEASPQAVAAIFRATVLPPR